MELPIKELMNLSHQRFIANLNKVVEKYEALSDELDDEVDFDTLQIVTDNGVLRNMKKSTLSRSTSSVLFSCFEKKPKGKKKKRRKVNAVEEINEENILNVDTPALDDLNINAENQQLEEISTSMLPKVHKLKISEIVNKEACFNYLKNNCQIRMKYMQKYKPRKSTVDDIFVYINAGKGAYELKINRSIEPVRDNIVGSCSGTKKSPSINSKSDILSKNKILTPRNIGNSKEKYSSQLSKKRATIENEDSNHTYLENCSFSKNDEKLTKQNQIDNCQKLALLSLNEDPCYQYKGKELTSHSLSNKNDVCFEGKINREFKTLYQSPRRKHKYQIRDSSGRFTKSPKTIICDNFNEVKVSTECNSSKPVEINSNKKCPETAECSVVLSKLTNPVFQTPVKRGKMSSLLSEIKTSIECNETNGTHLENYTSFNNKCMLEERKTVADFNILPSLFLSEADSKDKHLKKLPTSCKKITKQVVPKKSEKRSSSLQNKVFCNSKVSPDTFLKHNVSNTNENDNKHKLEKPITVVDFNISPSLSLREADSKDKYLKKLSTSCKKITNQVVSRKSEIRSNALQNEVYCNSKVSPDTCSKHVSNTNKNDNKHKLEKQITVADFNISPSLSLSEADSKNKYLKKLSNSCKKITQQTASRNSERSFSALQNEVFCDNKASPNPCSKYNASNAEKKFRNSPHNKVYPHLKNVPIDDLTIFDKLQ